MNRPLDSAADDGLGLGDAARLHARKFESPIVWSLAILRSADWLITESEGGVAVVTFVRRTWSRAAVVGVAYGASLALFALALLEGEWALAGLGLLAQVVILFVFAPRAARCVNSVRLHDCSGATWLITGVAAESDRRIGDRLMRRLIPGADRDGVTLVLSVERCNGRAIRLYKRHGFQTVHTDPVNFRMRREPASGG